MVTDDDLLAFLSGVRSVLRAEGIFIVDAFDASKMGEEERREERFDTDLGTVERRYTLKRQGRIVIWRAVYRLNDREYVDTQRLRVFKREELRGYLERSGFEVLRIREAKPSIAPAFVIVAKRT